MSTAFVTLAGACTMGMGYLPYFMMFECFTATVLFYMAHWQTYVTGKMRFGKFDVTEAQLIMMSTMMTSALFGTGFWGWQMVGVMPLRWMPLICGTIAALFSIPPTINHILFGGAGKNGATIAGTSVIGPIMPLLLVIVPGIYIAVNSTTMLYESNPIVAQMTKSELDTFDSVFLAPLILFVNQYLGTEFSESRLLWICLLFVTFDLFWYSSTVCLEICDATGWFLFKINSPASTSSSSSATSTTASTSNSSSSVRRNR